MSRRWILPCLLLLIFIPRPAHALDPFKRISQYRHTAWRVRDGVLGDSPVAIAQTTDGYIWIGTKAGLLRFDGVRFVSWKAPQEQSLSDTRIIALKGSRDGSLWIGTDTGLARWKDGRLTTYAEKSAGISTILEDPEGAIWVSRYGLSRSTQKGAICRTINVGLQCYDEAQGVPLKYANRLAHDNDGYLWIGSYLLCRWKPGSICTKFLDAGPNDRERDVVNALAADSSGSLWVGQPPAGRKGSLLRFIGGRWTEYRVPGLDDQTEIVALQVDRDNTLWIGTLGKGIYRVHDQRVDHFGSADGLSGDDVSALYEDREGNLWVVTSQGLDSLRDVRVATLSTREGLIRDEVYAVLASPSGAVWIANSGGLVNICDGKASALRSGREFPGRNAISLLEDHAGRLWVGIDHGLSVFDHGRFRWIADKHGRSLGVVPAMAEDVDGSVWAIAERLDLGQRLIRIHDMKVREEIPVVGIPRVRSLGAHPNGGLWLGLFQGGLARYHNATLERFPIAAQGTESTVQSLLVDPDGSVWAATGAGLVRWKEGRIGRLDSKNGLPCEAIGSVVRDNAGSLWLTAECGILVITDSALENWWKHPQTTLELTALNVFDGPRSTLNDMPSAARSRDGRLWFVVHGALRMVDPRRLAGNTVPPIVHVEQIIADGHIHLPLANLILPPRTHNLQIDYTAPSFVLPQSVRFRYQLEGHDSTWHEPGTRRQAFYSELSPGRYTFRVTASNDDGLWNDAGAAFTFSIAPAYFQTAWFQAISATALLVAGWGAHRVRLWQIARRLRAQFETRAADRARIADELHDTLIQDLAALTLQAEIADDQLPLEPDAAKHTLKTLRTRMQHVVSDGRRGMTELHLGMAGGDDLAEALSRAAQELRGSNGPSFHIVVQGLQRSLHPLVGDEVYRIAREAMTNAFRHAAARRVDVEVSFTSGDLRVRVNDDGRGVSDDLVLAGRPGHFGLQGMRTRAKNIGATLNVWSRVDVGTEVAVIVPGRSAFQRPCE